MKESVFSFEEKNYTTLVYLLSNCRQVLNIFKTLVEKLRFWLTLTGRKATFLVNADW